MFADERRSKIADLILREHSVTTSELVTLFQVSLETIRRDLENMEERGLLRRVHGGAVSIEKMRKFDSFTVRSKTHQLEKQQLALAACACIHEEDYIAIDCGTTAVELARCICSQFRKLTVLTNSLEVFHILTGSGYDQVILTGGHYLPEEKSFYGHLAVDMIRQLHVRKSFITPSGIALGYGISDYVKEVIEIQRTLLEIADEVYILANSAKFEACAPLKICDVDPGYTYLTDPELPETIRERYEQASIHIKKS